MGKNQHSKDTLHICPTEWARDHGGFKKARNTPFSKLPLNCCALSLQPFDTPVGIRDGAVFDIANIVPYIKRYKLSPISGARLDMNELIPLKFHPNAEGRFQCPITFKTFSDHSHVCFNAVSGHVYSYEAVEELNRKTKNWKDLITEQPFKWADIIVIQNPLEMERRLISTFYYMVKGQQEAVTAEISAREKQAKGTTDDDKDNVRSNAAIDRIYEEKRRLADEKAKTEAEKKAKYGGDNKALADIPHEKKTNDRYTDGAVAESFSCSAMPVARENSLRKLTDAEERLEIYALVRKKKAKGYVRLQTNVGMLNLELHCDIVPVTCDNFLALCEQEYYKGTIFHRLIKNFMIQGGDPTGTGKGGKSSFEGGRSFKDEFDSRLTHKGPGIVSMANSGKNTNKSQFFVSLKSCEHLNNKHSLFGRVVGGLELLKVFNDSTPTDEADRPVKDIKLMSTEVFKNPFKDAMLEYLKPPVEEKKIDPDAMWFSRRSDPMEQHEKRASGEVGKYLEKGGLRPLPGEKRKAPVAADVPSGEMEYVSVPASKKPHRQAFDFSSW